MPKNIPALTIAQMDAEGKRPTLLFELGLASTLRYVAYQTNVTFPTAGNLYTAKAIEIGEVGQSLEGQIGRITVKFDNVAKDMAAYANNEDFRGKLLIIKRIYLDEITLGTYYNEVFNGYMEKPTEISRHWLTVSATSGRPLTRKVLNFSYGRMCSWRFGGTECNTNGNADLTTLTASGTADSGTSSTLVDNALVQADDYWNFGTIKLTKAGVVYYRTVKDFVAASDTITFDVELPVAVNNATTYTVYKGCDKVWESCKFEKVWGPSADNSLNFGGFIHITKEEETT